MIESGKTGVQGHLRAVRWMIGPNFGRPIKLHVETTPMTATVMGRFWAFFSSGTEGYGPTDLWSWAKRTLNPPLIAVSTNKTSALWRAHTDAYCCGRHFPRQAHWPLTVSVGPTFAIRKFLSKRKKDSDRKNEREMKRKEGGKIIFS